MIGAKTNSSRYPGKRPDIFFNSHNIAAIRVTGEGMSQVVLMTGIAYDIAESAENLATAVELDIATQAIRGQALPVPTAPIAADILAETPATVAPVAKPVKKAS